MAGSVLQDLHKFEHQNIDKKKSIYLDVIRAEMNAAKRKIFNLQNELSNLRTAELAVQQALNRYHKMSDLEKFYVSDRYQAKDPLQSISPHQNYGPDPDSRIVLTRNQLSKGLEQYEAEKNRIESEIKRVQLELAKEKNILEAHQKEVDAMGKDADKFLTTDGISKRQFTETFMLYQISAKYRAITTNDAGERRYTSDTGFLRQCDRLINMFRAYTERNPFVINGDLILELDDPGSDKNVEALGLFLDRLRVVWSNPEFDSYSETAQKYISQMKSNLQDDFIGKNVQSFEDYTRVPATKDSFREATKNAQSSVNNLINSIPRVQSTIVWDSTSRAAAILSNFNSFISGLYKMPFCSAKEESETDKNKRIAVNLQTEVEKSAAAAFTEQLEKTREIVDSQKVIDTLRTMLRDVADAMESTSDMGVPSSNQMILSGRIYTASNLYQVRILNNAQIMLNYMDKMRFDGNLDTSTYNDYLGLLQASINPEIDNKPVP